MFYDFIYLAKGFRMRPKVRSTLNRQVWDLVGWLPEPEHEKTNKMDCVPSEASDQPGHLLKSDQRLHYLLEEALGL